MRKKHKKPPSQKKSPDYRGRKFRVDQIYQASAGDLLIAGQNYNFVLGQTNAKVYSDLIMLHFDDKGNLKAQYGLEREENNNDSKSQSNAQLLYESNDGKTLYWGILEIKDLKKDKELGDSKFKFLIYPNMTKIDLGAATIGNPVKFGQGKTDYFINNRYPFLKIGKGQIVFLGENKNGKTLWFAKMPLE